MDETLPSGLLIEILMIQREKKMFSIYMKQDWSQYKIEHIINNEKNLLQIFFSKFYIGSIVGQNLF